MIGSLFGYVGYDEGGQFTEAVCHKPYSMILFDEIEKAHPNVFNVLLQVLDDDRLTNNKGQTANFRNTIIIMTSNLGSHLIQDSFDKINTGNQAFILEETRNQLMELLRKTIRPEFLNRIDETIIFTPLTRENINKVVRLQFEQVIKRLLATDLKIDITEAAIDWLTSVGYEPHFGARPVKRILQKYILNELSKRILSGTVDKSKTIVIDEENSELVFKNQAN